MSVILHFQSRKLPKMYGEKSSIKLAIWFDGGNESQIYAIWRDSSRKGCNQGRTIVLKQRDE